MKERLMMMLPILVVGLSVALGIYRVWDHTHPENAKPKEDARVMRH